MLHTIILTNISDKYQLSTPYSSQDIARTRFFWSRSPWQSPRSHHSISHKHYAIIIPAKYQPDHIPNENKIMLKIIFKLNQCCVCCIYFLTVCKNFLNCSVSVVNSSRTIFSVLWLYNVPVNMPFISLLYICLHM